MRRHLPVCLTATAWALLLSCGRSEVFDGPRHPSSDVGVRADARTAEPSDAGDEPPDAARPRWDGGSYRDAAVPFRDAGGPGRDAAGCPQPAIWLLQPRTIKSVRRAGDFASPRISTTHVLEVEVQLDSACEELARVEFVVQPLSDSNQVLLSAFAWVLDVEGCEPAAPTVTTPVFLDQTAFQAPGAKVVVVDFHGLGSGALLSFQPICETSPCFCDYPNPGGWTEFEPCGRDCECASGLACRPTLGPGGVAWSCLRPCGKHTDCPESGCRLADPTSPWTCGALDACRGPEDCPDGFECQLRDSARFCEDQRTRPGSAPCRCDAQCPAGQKCISGGEAATCEVPCSDDQDCPWEGMKGCSVWAICEPL